MCSKFGRERRDVQVERGQAASWVCVEPYASGDVCRA